MCFKTHQLQCGSEIKTFFAEVHVLTHSCVKNSEGHAIKGEIKNLYTKVLDHKITLSIKDSGKGIEEQNLKHIFDPFFTTKDPGQGTGLGLSISKKIILEHNGEIICESAPHKGTTILITFPLVYSKE